MSIFIGSPNKIKKLWRDVWASQGENHIEAIYTENNIKPINTTWGQYAKFLNVTASSYTNSWAHSSSALS
jgi:hypothetical protein